MTIVLKSLLISAFFIFGFSQSSYAASEADCAIWLCLPGGFPTGCSAAHSAFKDRIKHGRPPLPDLPSCTKGPDGKKSNGNYQMGYEYFEPCKAGYTLQEKGSGYFVSGKCVQSNCRRYWNNVCPSYEAIKRASPRYVKMWVNGIYTGQFFY